MLSQVLSYAAVASLIFFAIGLRNVENYKDPFVFVGLLMSCGILFGIIVFKIISYFYPLAKTYKNKKGIRIIFPLTFSFAFIFFGLGRVLNEYSDLNSSCQNYQIQEMLKSGRRSRTHYIIINTPQGNEKLDFGSSFYNQHKVGDSLGLCLVKGKLSFEYYRQK